MHALRPPEILTMVMDFGFNEIKFLLVYVFLNDAKRPDWAITSYKLSKFQPRPKHSSDTLTNTKFCFEIRYVKNFSQMSVLGISANKASNNFKEAICHYCNRKGHTQLYVSKGKETLR